MSVAAPKLCGCSSASDAAPSPHSRSRAARIRPPVLSTIRHMTGFCNLRASSDEDFACKCFHTQSIQAHVREGFDYGENSVNKIAGPSPPCRCSTIESAGRIGGWFGRPRVPAFTPVSRVSWSADSVQENPPAFPLRPWRPPRFTSRRSSSALRLGRRPFVSPGRRTWRGSGRSGGRG